MKTIIDLSNIEADSLEQKLGNGRGYRFKANTALAYLFHAFPDAWKIGKVTITRVKYNNGQSEYYKIEQETKDITIGVNYSGAKDTIEVIKEEPIGCATNTETRVRDEKHHESCIYSILENPRNKKGKYLVKRNYRGSYCIAIDIEYYDGNAVEQEAPSSYNVVRRTSTDYYKVSSDFRIPSSSPKNIEWCGKELYYDKYNPQLTPEIASGYMRMITPEYAKELSAAFNRGENLTKIPNGYVVTPPDNQTQLTIVYELDENYQEQIRITREERVFPDFKDTYDKDGFRVTRYLLTLKDESIAKIDKKDNKPALKVTRTASLNGNTMESEDIYFKINNKYELLTYLGDPLDILETEKRNGK